MATTETAAVKATAPASGAEAAASPADHAAEPGRGFLALVLGSIGVVYGDIGTSPLYAFREAARAAGATATSDSSTIVLGVLSLIFWALVVVVTLKYVVFLIRADNNGEGGTLALMALARKAVGGNAVAVILVGMVAAALFYGDAVITPAISVLSAVEGLEIAAPHLDRFVLPITIVILVGLFMVQSRGTARVATFFGPITAIWFVVIAFLGVIHIVDNPSVLAALSPVYGIGFLFSNGLVGLVTLGAVFLAVTGAEALYADLGHFGRRPIQVAWLFFVFPALVLNYFGQGALVLANPAAIDNPFFVLAPDWALLPLVGLATAATIIASQAVITGAYSVSQQAVQLGLLPRLEIRHTSATQAGQIYMPRVNTFLLVGVVLLAGLFRTSEALAGAYGIAVTGTMVVTAILAFVVLWKWWKWRWYFAALVVVPFLVIDLGFFAANLLKVFQGGWFPLALAAALVVVMATWRRGSRLLFEKTRRLEVPLDTLVASLEAHPPPRVAGTAVFLTGDPDSTPTALLHSLKHFKVLHELNMIATVVTTHTPRVEPSDRVTLEWRGRSFARMTIRYGFMESPNLPAALAVARKLGWTFDIMSTSFFLSRRSLRPSPTSGMPHWQDKLFILLARSSDDASNYFRIPTNRVVEIGTQVVI